MHEMIFVLVGYLFGSILTADLIANKYRGIKASQMGSGNPGMANVMTEMGFRPGLFVLLGDILKVIAAIAVSALILAFLNGNPLERISFFIRAAYDHAGNIPEAAYYVSQRIHVFRPLDTIFHDDVVLMTGLGCLLGHDFSIFNRGRGGKGVAVSCIWLILCMPFWGAACCIAGGLITVLTGLLPVGAAVITFLAIPFAYVLISTKAAVIMAAAFVLMMYKFRKDFKAIADKTVRVRFGRKKSKAAAAVSVLIFAIAVLCAVVNGIVSAALVPSFMEQLDAFEELTVKGYSEQVHTDDIADNRETALSDTQIWYKQADKKYFYTYSADGYKLIGTEFSADSHDWVVLLHGYTGWKEEMYQFAFWYNTHGYNVLVPDLRCQGSSEGDFIGMGLTDSDDVLLWLDHINRNDEQANIVLHGQSMGASCALILSGRGDLPENVSAVISDSAYTDGYSMFGDKAVDWFSLPPYPLVDIACVMLRTRGGYDLKKASAIEAVKRSDVPTLFIHGDKDLMINVDMAYELYEAEAAKKELLIIEGAGHGQTQDKDPETYYEAIEKFLGK